jgi:hypothetical protein
MMVKRDRASRAGSKTGPVVFSLAAVFRWKRAPGGGRVPGPAQKGGDEVWDSAACIGLYY